MRFPFPGWGSLLAHQCAIITWRWLWRLEGRKVTSEGQGKRSKKLKLECSLAKRLWWHAAAIWRPGLRGQTHGQEKLPPKPDLTPKELVLWAVTVAHPDNPPVRIPSLWSHSQLALGPDFSMPPPGWWGRTCPSLCFWPRFSPIGIAALESHNFLKAVVTGPQ